MRMRSRGLFRYDGDAASAATGLPAGDDGMTQQQFAEECDINTIVRRFKLTGEMPVGVRPPVFGDFTDVMDFQTAMEAVVKAREAFDALPAEVRYEFHNDPQRFVEFSSDQKNLPRLRELGLAVPEPVPEPPAPPLLVQVVEASPSSPTGSTAPAQSIT